MVIINKSRYPSSMQSYKVQREVQHEFLTLWKSIALQRITSSFFKFLYYLESLESEQFILLFSNSLFKIHFLIDSLSHLNIISLFILYSFYIHSQQLYFLIKSVIFTIFFAILSQESHQNLMWKVVTSSNLNPLLKLYFYSPILANYLKFIVKIFWQYF